MDRIRFIEHRGHRILVLDYSDIRDPAQALAAIEAGRRLVATHPPRSLLLMTIVRGARYNADVLQAMKSLASHNAPFVKASAIVGLSALHRAAYRTVLLFTRRNIPAYDTEQEAMDWLADQATAEVPAGAA
ncbi:MAG: hypothetical protein JO306_08240 [Gemmatimonadetes bacterium]|nr:hypothetical protein [Gemmatimonadota bacterium]